MCCAASCGARCGTRTFWAPRSRPSHAGACADARDGAGLSGAGARTIAHHGDDEGRGGAIWSHPRPRDRPAGRGGVLAARRRRTAGGDRVQALRHVRLSLRPDGGRAAAARADGGPRRVRGGDGRAEGEVARGVVRHRRCGGRAGVVRRSRTGGCDGVSRLYDDRGGRCGRRHRGGRQGGVLARGRAGSIDRLQPDPVLCRVGWPGRRPRRCPPRRGAVHGAGRGEGGRRTARASRGVGGRRSACRRCADVDGRCRAARHDPRKPFRDAYPARMPAAHAGRPCGAERLAGGPGAAAVRLFSPRADRCHRPCSHRGERERPHPRERHGGYARDGDRGRHEVRGPRAVRREVWRRSARGVAGA